jgi:hypothetical protein
MGNIGIIGEMEEIQRNSYRAMRPGSLAKASSKQKIHARNGQIIS